MVFNNPKFMLVVATLSSICQGSIMPLFAGLLLSKVLSLTSVPFEVIAVMFPGKEPKVALEDEMNFYCMIMGLLAFGSFLAVFLQKYCFLLLGEEVTLGVRCLLY